MDAIKYFIYFPDVEDNMMLDSNAKARFRLSAEELNKFHKNGYIGPFDLYEAQEMV
jgi:hypothetical protein